MVTNVYYWNNNHIKYPPGWSDSTRFSEFLKIPKLKLFKPSLNYSLWSLKTCAAIAYSRIFQLIRLKHAWWPLALILALFRDPPKHTSLHKRHWNMQITSSDLHAARALESQLDISLSNTIRLKRMKHKWATVRLPSLLDNSISPIVAPSKAKCVKQWWARIQVPFGGKDDIAHAS